MGKAIREHIRSNVVGYIAIFMFAMGGTAYATHPGGDNTIDSGDIIGGEVRGTDINNVDGVRSADVRDDTLAGGGLEAADLGPGSVASSELATDAIPADGTFSDGSTKLAAGSVGTSEIIDEGIQQEDLDAFSVGSAQIESGAVGSSEVRSDSLLSLDLAPDSVGSSEVAPGAIGTAEIIDGQVTHPDLGPDAVAGENVFPSSLTGSDILANSLTDSDIANGSLTGTDIANGSLGTGEFASSIPAARVTRTVGQSIPQDTGTALNFTAERYDTANMHTTSSPNFSRLTAPVTGIYAVTASIRWANNCFGYRVISLHKNGNPVDPVGAEGIDADTGPFCGVDQNVNTMLKLAAGDYLEVEVFQNSGGNLSVLRHPEWTPEFSMTWLAPG